MVKVIFNLGTYIVLRDMQKSDNKAVLSHIVPTWLNKSVQLTLKFFLCCPLQHSSILPWRQMMLDWWPSESWIYSKQCQHSAPQLQAHPQWPPLHFLQIWCSRKANKKLEMKKHMGENIKNLSLVGKKKRLKTRSTKNASENLTNISSFWTKMYHLWLAAQNTKIIV